MIYTWQSRASLVSESGLELLAYIWHLKKAFAEYKPCKKQFYNNVYLCIISYLLYRIPLPLLAIFQQYDSCQFYCKQSTLSHWISFCDKLDHVVFSSHGHRCNKQHAIHTISKFDQSFIIVWVIYICVFKKFSRSTNNICISILQYTVVPLL